MLFIIIVLCIQLVLSYLLVSGIYRVAQNQVKMIKVLVEYLREIIHIISSVHEDRL